MASATAWTLYSAGIPSIFMMETAVPEAVRRTVSFSEAVYKGSQTILGVTGVLTESISTIPRIWDEKQIAIIVDPQWESIARLQPEVLIDAIIAKRNLGTRREDARLVIGLGPGFTAGQDVHAVIETLRGPCLGMVMTAGSAEPDTGVPGVIAGVAADRVLRSSANGEFRSERSIGDRVRRGDVVGTVDDIPVLARTDGILRGLIRSHRQVSLGMKIGDIDPRMDVGLCRELSDKARTIADSVLQVVKAHAAAHS
jgi:xanthine dehydrogenase accessory factor